MSSHRMTRGEFLRRAGSVFVVAALDRSWLAVAAVPSRNHPDPRAGITSEKVLTVERLGEKARKEVLEAFEAARQYPQVFDGLACGCGCHGEMSYHHRSLLVCYETTQPIGCGACRMEAAFVGKMAKEGKTLAEIRIAVDKKFGD